MGCLLMSSYIVTKKELDSPEIHTLPQCHTLLYNDAKSCASHSAGRTHLAEKWDVRGKMGLSFFVCFLSDQ